MDPIQSLNSYMLGAPPARERRTEMDAQAFMMLLSVQLANQNPLEPMNDRDFFAQMAQLGTVTGLNRIENSLQVAQASSLMGRTITAVRESVNGQPAAMVTGHAEKVYLQSGQYWLTLRQDDGTAIDVRMANIRSVEL